MSDLKNLLDEYSDPAYAEMRADLEAITGPRAVAKKATARKRKKSVGRRSAAVLRKKKPLLRGEELFWSKITRGNGCWTWKGSPSRSGYGQHWFRGKLWYSHRLAWTLTHGPIPHGMFVLHRCDNRLCARPEHLELGTHEKNTADAVARGRFKGNRKLTSQQVQRIRTLAAAGIPRRMLAKKFGVQHNQISRIVRRLSWKNVL